MKNTLVRIIVELRSYDIVRGETFDGPDIASVAYSFTEEEIGLLVAPIAIMGETVMEMIASLQEQAHE